MNQEFEVNDEVEVIYGESMNQEFEVNDEVEVIYGESIPIGTIGVVVKVLEVGVMVYFEKYGERELFNHVLKLVKKGGIYEN